MLINYIINQSYLSYDLLKKNKFALHFYNNLIQQQSIERDTIEYIDKRLKTNRSANERLTNLQHTVVFVQTQTTFYQQQEDFTPLSTYPMVTLNI